MQIYVEFSKGIIAESTHRNAKVSQKGVPKLSGTGNLSQTGSSYDSYDVTNNSKILYFRLFSILYEILNY